MDEECSDWDILPDLLLETIFRLLTIKERRQASGACTTWRQMFYEPRVWETFILLEPTFTRRMFTYSLGYQRELAPWKAHLCLLAVGRYFKKMVIPPISDYYNLHEFLRVLTAFLEYYDESPMPLLKSFHFTFSGVSREMTGVIVHGTGGRILEQLTQLLKNLMELRDLRMNQLLLNIKEAPDILNVVAMNCQESLRRLELINYTKEPYPLIQVAQFWSLNELVLSPAQLNEEVVLLLAATAVTRLRLVQDTYSTLTKPVPAEAWCELKAMSPWLRVRLEMRGTSKGALLLLQPEAPVSAVIYSTPYSQLSSSSTLEVADLYRDTLEMFVHERLPRVHGPRNFCERGDANLVQLVNTCRRLQTLVVRERLSTATVLLLVKNARALKKLYVRQNALIKRVDWPPVQDWSPEFRTWFKQTSRSYELVKQEVSRILGYRWRPLLDEEFKLIRLAQ